MTVENSTVLPNFGVIERLFKSIWIGNHRRRMEKEMLFDIKFVFGSFDCLFKVSIRHLSRIKIYFTIDSIVLISWLTSFRLANSSSRVNPSPKLVSFG